MYKFSVTLPENLQSCEPKVIEALKEQGFGVLTEIDIQSTLKKKLDVDKLPYKILGACNPPLAHQALEAEPDIGLLLPCNVVLRETENGQTVVSFMDPSAVLTLVDRDDVAELAAEVKQRLQQVSQALEGGR